MRASLVCIALFGLLCSAGKLVAETEFLALQKRVTDIYEQYADAVVRVKAIHTVAESEEADPNDVSVRIGSGFFISKEGLLLVNASRVYDAERVVIEHKGTNYLAQVVGMDRQINVALLKAEFLPNEFGFIRMNDATTLPPAGTLAVSISCPFTFSPTPKLTMVSGHDTRFLQRLFPTTYIRVDQALTKGEGGAPIIDLQGRLIGMLLASIQETGASYALPARAIDKVKDDLLLEGHIVYASVGIEVEQLFLRGGESHVTVKGVSADSPAENAGIEDGDIIRRVGDYDIREISDFPNAMFFIRVGEFVTFQVEREGTLMDFNMQTVARSPEEPFVRIKPLTREEAHSVAADIAQAEPESVEPPAQSADEAGEVDSAESVSPAEVQDAFSVGKEDPGPVLEGDA